MGTIQQRMKIISPVLKYLSRKKADAPKPKTWEEYVVRSILNTNEVGIVAVAGLKVLKSIYWDEDKYQRVVSFIRAGNLAALMEVPLGDRHPTFNEDVDVVKFQSQTGDTFIATVYDSDELWQDPQVIEIFPTDGIVGFENLP